MSWKRISLLALTLSVGSAVAQTTPPQPAAPKPVTLERELLERVATPFYGPGSTTAQILIGKLPADLGFALPAGSRVIGSVSTRSQAPSFPAGVTVYFDTAQTPTQVEAYFAKALPGAGWKVFPRAGNDPYGEGGFQPTAVSGGGYYYRQSPNQAQAPDQTLGVMAQRVGQVTQVRLSVERTSNLKQMLSYARPDGPSYPSLPKLQAPANATVSSRGGGGNGNNITQYAGIESGLSRAALYDFYAAQLKKAGWKLSNRAETGKLLSTLWTFTDDGAQRVGIFLLNEVAKGQYRATLATQGLE